MTINANTIKPIFLIAAMIILIAAMIIAGATVLDMLPGVNLPLGGSIQEKALLAIACAFIGK
jgi:hypothetical protein